MAKQHKSNRGTVVDMNKLILRHHDDIAVGNSKQNAGGDLLGPRGRVIKSAEEVARDYYKKTTPKQTKTVSIKADPLDNTDKEDWEEAVSVPEATNDDTKSSKKPAKRKIKSIIDQEIKVDNPPKQDADDWVEDADGNFVKPTELKEDKE